MDIDKLPKYYQLKKFLIEKIEQEEFKLNEPILSERELITLYGVSRITVRRAINELVNEGYLYTVQGKGTFVKNDRYSQDLFSITSCTQDIINFGMKPGRKVIASGVIPADKKRQRLLHLREGEKVFFLERVYFADDEPINLTKTYLPYPIVPGIENFDFSQQSLYDVMKDEYGIVFTNAVRTIEAVLADEEVRELLHVNSGIPILQFYCTTYGEINGIERPIETFRCHYRSDRFKFYIKQTSRSFSPADTREMAMQPDYPG